MAEAPENTCAAFDKALEYPIDGIEFDVQLSKDGVPVVYHNHTLDLIGLTDRLLDEFNYNKLKSFEWGKWFSKKFRYQRLPTLKQVLARYGAKTCLFIELKVNVQQSNDYYSRIVHRTLKLIDNLCIKSISDIHVLSFDLKLLEDTYHNAPHLKYIFNLEDVRSADELNMLSRTQPFLFGYCLPIERANADFVECAHRHGLHVFTYSCDFPNQIEKAFDLMIDGIMTNDPEKFFQYVLNIE